MCLPSQETKTGYLKRKIKIETGKNITGIDCMASKLIHLEDKIVIHFLYNLHSESSYTLLI